MFAAAPWSGRGARLYSTPRTAAGAPITIAEIVDVIMVRMIVLPEESIVSHTGG